jgi:guanine deaminase
VSSAQTILGPILNPRASGSVDFIKDGAIACDDAGTITYIGRAATCPPSLASSRNRRDANGIILPPFLDAHTHIPQHPIRGHFLDGVDANPPEGRLIAGLNRNVFPAEAKCADPTPVEWVLNDFHRDTLAQGVVGGAAYMTVHPVATRIALLMRPDIGRLWSIGLVLMNMNCPPQLRTNEATIERDLREFAGFFELLGGVPRPGRDCKRFIITDRFAVAVDSKLRRLGVSIAKEFDLRMQTHLNEQVREKQFVERKLYPDAASYTDVYHRDGLLDCDPILAHCIHMTPAEYDLVARTGSHVAHCPTSNTLLASGVMSLDEILDRNIDYAICTDVGASPTTSMLAEMAQYLKVHAGRSKHATPQEALYRSTLGPARMLRLANEVGSLEPGMPMSFIEVEPLGPFGTVDDAILTGLLGISESDLHEPARRAALDALAAVRLGAGPQMDLLDLDVRDTATRLENRILSVTLDGREVFRRPEGPTL